MSARPYTTGDDPDYTAALPDDPAQAAAEWQAECDAIERGLIQPPREVVPVDADAPAPF